MAIIAVMAIKAVITALAVMAMIVGNQYNWNYKIQLIYLLKSKDFPS